jgi:Flp pilus assembly protein TadD
MMLKLRACGALEAPRSDCKVERPRKRESDFLKMPKKREEAQKAGKEKTRQELIEEMFRPDPTLGYGRDRLGQHLLECHAYKIAESQFRRGIWLNPYEARFKAHLAWCLLKDGRVEEAE